jgi:hypothetical protein
MKHEHIQDLFLRFLDNDLNVEEQAQVIQHLSACSDCQRELESYRFIVSAVNSLEPPELSPMFKARVMERIWRESEPWWKKITDFLFVPFHIKIPIQAGSVFLVVLLSLTFYARYQQSTYFQSNPGIVASAGSSAAGKRETGLSTPAPLASNGKTSARPTGMSRRDMPVTQGSESETKSRNRAGASGMDRNSSADASAGVEIARTSEVMSAKKEGAVSNKNLTAPAARLAVSDSPEALSSVAKIQPEILHMDAGLAKIEPSSKTSSELPQGRIHLPIQQEWQGDASKQLQPRQIVIFTESQFRQEILPVLDSATAEQVLASIDFDQNILLAVFLGQKNTGGYTVKMSDVVWENGRLLVSIQETSPRPGDMVTAAQTSPYRLIRILRQITKGPALSAETPVDFY